MDTKFLFFVLLGLTCVHQSKQQNDNFYCVLAPEMGPCEAAMTRFYYNPQTDSCEKFMYGGCQGNQNNFMSEEDCLKACALTKLE